MSSASASRNKFSDNAVPLHVPHEEPGRHVFFSPHADDVVLSCGGAIHSLVSRGKDVQVIGVFAGVPGQQNYSAFARHLHSKWHLPSDPIVARWEEDTAAMQQLGIDKFERWDYLEAPYRVRADGSALYLGNEQLVREPAADDQALRDQLAQTMRAFLARLPQTATLYFPLALGGHVDHRILYDLGLQLSGAGWAVRFYEDYPYVRDYQLARHEAGWQPETVPIDIAAKLRAACAYTSQLRGLGGTPTVLEERLRAFATSVNGGSVSERYWQISAGRIGALGDDSLAQRLPKSQPLVRKEPEMRLRDFGKFLKTFRWHDLDEVLPSGTGNCLDVGCGSGRHRQLAEARGYRWVGLDRHDKQGAIVSADAAALPLVNSSIAALIAWQVFEYAEQPEQIVAEAARVLEPGGVFCGSVSFLEPVHGQTYFNLSPLILRRLLSKQGFTDVEIKPGINGLALVLWTWLSRSSIPLASRVALPLALVAVAPLAAVMFFVSWCSLRVGRGSGHTMRWLAETGPLEFAGHVMFVARKTL